MGASKRINIGNQHRCGFDEQTGRAPSAARKDDTLHAEAESCSRFPVKSSGIELLAAITVTGRYRSGTAVAPVAQGLFYTASRFAVAPIAVTCRLFPFFHDPARGVISTTRHCVALHTSD
jgi:hypothetical protein